MTTVNGGCFNCNKAYLNCYQTCPNSPVEKTSAKPILVETQKPKTNFDKITESVESLAKYIYIYEVTDTCPISEHDTPCNRKCEECIKEWLQKEADNE